MTSISKHITTGTPVTLMFILIIVAGYIGSYILTIQKENSMLREVHTEQSEELSQQDELIKVMMDYIQLNTQISCNTLESIR